MTTSVWLVELWHDQKGWLPTVGVALGRDAAKLVLAEWRRTNPNLTFRLRRYEPR